VVHFALASGEPADFVSAVLDEVLSLVSVIVGGVLSLVSPVFDVVLFLLSTNGSAPAPHCSIITDTFVSPLATGSEIETIPIERKPNPMAVATSPAPTRLNIFKIAAASFPYVLTGGRCEIT